MAEFTRTEIAALTGLPPSTLTRHLARFPSARSGRGRYSTADADFSAWLVSGRPAGEHDGAAPPLQSSGREMVALPSGVPIDGAAWTLLRGPDETAALRELARLVAVWRLRPHWAVPDLLPLEPLALPGLTVTVNSSQFRVLRGPNERRAEAALDVLLRSWRKDP